MLKGREHFGMIIRLLQNLQSYTEKKIRQRRCHLCTFFYFFILLLVRFSQTSEVVFFEPSARNTLSCIVLHPNPMVATGICFGKKTLHQGLKTQP